MTRVFYTASRSDVRSGRISDGTYHCVFHIVDGATVTIFGDSLATEVRNCPVETLEVADTATYAM